MLCNGSTDENICIKRSISTCDFKFVKNHNMLQNHFETIPGVKFPKTNLLLNREF